MLSREEKTGAGRREPSGKKLAALVPHGIGADPVNCFSPDFDQPASVPDFL